MRGLALRFRAVDAISFRLLHLFAWLRGGRRGWLGGHRGAFARLGLAGGRLRDSGWLLPTTPQLAKHPGRHLGKLFGRRGVC